MLASADQRQQQPTGAASGPTGYSSYGVTKGSGRSGGSSGGGGGASFGGADQCPRCGKAVYMAEKIIGAGSVSDPLPIETSLRDQSMAGSVEWM